MPQKPITDPNWGLAPDSPRRVTDPNWGAPVNAPRPAVPAEEPSLARRVLTPVADAVVGAGKGLLNTVIGAGQVMHDYVPPVRVASDLVQRAAFGDVQPSGPLFDAARRDVQPRNTAEKVGFGAEQVGEFFALPGGAGTLAVKAGTQAVGAGGLSLLQGASPTAAGVSGAVAAASPVVGKALESVGPALRRSAEKGVEKALGATKERFKAMAAKLAPEFLKRDVGGVLGKSREAIYKEAKANATVAGRAVDSALKASEGNVVNTKPIIQALDDAKAAYLTPRTITAAELAVSPALARKARQLPSGDFEVDVVLDSRPIQQLSRLQTIIENLGPDATVGQIVAARRVWDTVVAQAGGYAQRAGGAIGVPLREQSEVWAKREATKAIRSVLDQSTPSLAAVNKEYAFWKSLDEVVGQTLKRTAPQKGGLGKTIMTAGGMAVGAASGDGAVDRAEKALLVGALANRFDKVLTSPRWTLASARIKNDMAEAIASGSASRINAVLSRATAGAVVQGAR